MHAQASQIGVWHDCGRYRATSIKDCHVQGCILLRDLSEVCVRPLRTKWRYVLSLFCGWPGFGCNRSGFSALGGVWRPPRDPKSLGGPRWREGKSQGCSRPSEGGRVLRFLGRPEGLQGERSNLRICRGFSRICRGSLGQPRRLRGAQESPREAPGAPGAAQK